jgi:hypothetical protein
MLRAISATPRNSINELPHKLRNYANLRKNSARLVRNRREFRAASAEFAELGAQVIDFVVRRSFAASRSLTPYPLKSLDLFAAAEFPHTPCAHFRALEGRAKRRVHFMGGAP